MGIMKKDSKKKRVVKVVDIVPGERKSSRQTHTSSEEAFEVWEHEMEKEVEGVDTSNSDEQENEFLKELRGMNKSKKDTAKEVQIPREITPGQRRKRVMIISVGVVVMGALAWVAVVFMPRVDILITANKVPWKFNDAIIVNKDLTQIDNVNLHVPGEVFPYEKTVVLSFHASGEQEVSRKARGELYIVNAYSSDYQALVVNTRFETPDGKIYRITEGVNVPGAKIVDGVIQPSRIAVDVIADKAGEKYNIEPIEKFTIPGFTGSDKFKGFYGTSEKPIGGGYVGVAPYPTAEDIENAKTQARTTLEVQLSSFLGAQIPPNFTVIDGANDIREVSVEINDEVDDKGMFSVIAKGEVRTMIFKEEDVLELLRLTGIEENELGNNFNIKDRTIAYEQPHVNWEKGTMSVPVNYQTTFWRAIDHEIIRHEVQGKKEVELKAYILAVPGVDKLTVSFWPFWVSNVPQDIERVEVKVE